jgi:hypothetical protein
MSQNLQIVQSLSHARSTGDGPLIFALMDPGIVWHEAESFPYDDRNPYIGPAAIIDGVFNRLATEWTDFQAIPNEFIDGGSAIVVLGRYSGIYKHTHHLLNAQFAHIWHVADGRIIRFQQYTDTHQAQSVVQK